MLIILMEKLRYLLICMYITLRLEICIHVLRTHTYTPLLYLKVTVIASLSWGVVMLNKAVNRKGFAFILLFLWKLFESYIIISDTLEVPLRFFA